MSKRLSDKKRPLDTSILKDEILKGTILRYGYAAAIEVTNTLNDVERENKKTHKMEIVKVYDGKADQVSTAKGFLEQIVRGAAKIDSGLAYNGYPVDPPDKMGLDFLIDINGYESNRLEEVAEEMLGKTYLKSGRLNDMQRELIWDILDRRNQEIPLPDFFSYTKMELCAELIGEDPVKYYDCFSTIRGLCMELYIKSLFSDEIEDGMIYHSYNFKYNPNSKTNLMPHEADEIVVCREEEFYTAIKNISDRGNFETWVRRWEES